MDFYYGLVDIENKGYGFVEEDDPCITDDFIKITEEEHDNLLEEQSGNKEIVCYDGRVFATEEIGRYYVDDNGQWQVLSEEEYTKNQAQKERERLNNLSMTRGDMFEALILAKGLTKTQVRTMIENAELDDITKALYLNRFDEALTFYRGYPIFNMLGTQLNITSDMLDKFFETKDYHDLIAQ